MVGDESHFGVETHFGFVETPSGEGVETHFGVSIPILWIVYHRWRLSSWEHSCLFVKGEIHGFVTGELPRRHYTRKQSGED